jgi:two-component system response regulator HydG
MVAWAPDGKIVSFNPAAEALYRLAAAQAIGMNIEALMPESQRAEFRERQERVRRGERLPLGEAFRLSGGQEIEVEESLFVVHDTSGAPVRVASVAREVGEIDRLRRAAEILGGSGTTASADREPGPLSSRMRDTLAAADVVAENPDATVLLLGETGVGKSWLARYVHSRSPRSARPLFELNCASLEPNLIESELFGHERGAFTGASAQKRGIVEVAEAGTLFLDEIGELPPPAQAKLLTFLESRSFRRLGGTRTMSADVRLIAATNANLKQLVERGAFRRDLYFRLSVVPIEVPPLRERREEIPGLVRAMLQELRRRPAGETAAVERAALSALKRYDWPGNVRELRNVLERALILSRGGRIEVQHLSPEVQRNDGAAPASERLDDVERAHITAVLESMRGNRTLAAQALGISRSTLQRKLGEMQRRPR